jgi:hypothetical protein
MLWRISPGRSRSPPAGFILPAHPTLVTRPPAGPDWIHEVKHDGNRLIARKVAGRVALWTRHGTDFTDRLPRIAEAVRSLPVESALIDGEAVVFRSDGHSDFSGRQDDGEYFPFREQIGDETDWRRIGSIRRCKVDGLTASKAGKPPQPP